MTQITFLSPGGQKTTLTATNGESLMEAAVDHDVPGIDADCQGGCACATCHVVLTDGIIAALPPIEEDELYLLDFLDNRQKNSRLSCQIEVTEKLDGMIVTIPEL